MTREEFMDSIKPKAKVQGDVLLTWYDENNEEFVIYIDNYKGTTKRMFNYQYKWNRFECKLNKEEFIDFLGQLPEGSINDNQMTTILSEIRANIH